ncbi:carbohydrate ABC transporter permease [Ruania alba]|uniref:Carbohydrate ABC transporter membrane protein 1, CUT1 family n=1 Tax=Ruania alba TaxID=648782 RepID=A0A1H5B703_9MICO|nr:sugar ABC transporter permease [Ruania alba]SED50001.1 carbohydrate ABC transporter membrane protein 1, CUT1 family [Ruania alba]
MTSSAALHRPPARPSRRRRRRHRDNGWGYLFLAPWLAGLFLLTLGPMLASLYLAFTDFDLFTTPEWVGASNFITMFTDDESFLASLRVTATYVAIGVPLELLMALGVALALNRGLRGLSLYRSVYYLPSLLGGSVAIAVLWRQVFGGDGLVNQFLAMFGIHGPSWISDPDYALHTLIVLHVWQFGAPMVIFLAGLRQIPQELYDAASVDGAGRLAKFIKVTIPMLSPVIFFNLVLRLINSFQAFTPAYIISGGSGGPVDSTLFYTLYLYKEGFVNFRMGYASALAWFLLAVIAILTAINFLASKYWVHYER